MPRTDRICDECELNPIIKGNSWKSHCRDYHANRSDVRF
jgi:hypothetical protein